MKKIQKITLLYLIYSLSSSITYSQNSKDLNLKTQGANQLMIEKKYSIAKDIWLDIVKLQPKNANTNYKTGVCLLESSKFKIRIVEVFKSCSEED